MVGPVGGFLDELGADGVFNHILPFVVVAFASAELGVPEIRLPDGGVLAIGPVARGVGFPEGDPARQGHRRVLARGAKQVQVVRHEHIAANEPGIGGGPGLAECAVNGVAGEDAFFVFRADGEKNDGWVVGKFEHIPASGVAAADGVHEGELIYLRCGWQCDSAEGRPPCRPIFGAFARPRCARGVHGGDGAPPSGIFC